MSNRILIADDDHSVVAAIDLLLREEGYTTLTANDTSQIVFHAKKAAFDLILMDMNYQLDTTSGQEGLEIIKAIRELDKDVAIVAMTGWGSIELSVNAIKSGANDFIEKPWDNARLLSVIRNQLALKQKGEEARHLGQENRQLKQNLLSDQGVIAIDPSSQSVLNTAEQIADTDISVLILGENGTGKSLLAEHIHKHSSRKEGPFIPVNMGAIPENLFESEMFGHVKGAFTDAHKDRVGRFQMANGGTLFLDEIADIPLAQQVKLLRVLETREFEAVGSSETQKANVRVICATNADIHTLIKQGKFREDLFYRLSTMDITLPPLRMRPLDIKPIVEKLIDRISKKYQKSDLVMSQEAYAALLSYSWPGNIRELSHCVERAVILSRGEVIHTDALRLGGQPSPETKEHSRLLTMDEIEQQAIEARLLLFEGNALQTAASLGLSKSAYYRRLEKFQIRNK